MENRVLYHLGMTLPLAIATFVGFTDNNPAFAQLTPDNTLGAESSVVIQQQLQDLIQWAEAGVVPTSQVQWVVDTRKMLLMSQFHMFARLARQNTMALVRSYITQAYVENKAAKEAKAFFLSQSYAFKGGDSPCR